MDYGHTEELPLDGFFFLGDNFVKQLPFQAIKCGLNELAPSGGSDSGDSLAEWSIDAMNTFRTITYEGNEGIFSENIHILIKLSLFA